MPRRNGVPTRHEQRVARRQLFYRQLIDDADTPGQRMCQAYDYLRGALARAESGKADDTAGRVAEFLVRTADALTGQHTTTGDPR